MHTQITASEAWMSIMYSYNRVQSGTRASLLSYIAFVKDVLNTVFFYVSRDTLRAEHDRLSERRNVSVKQRLVHQRLCLYQRL